MTEYNYELTIHNLTNNIVGVGVVEDTLNAIETKRYYSSVQYETDELDALQKAGVISYVIEDRYAASIAASGGTGGCSSECSEGISEARSVGINAESEADIAGSYAIIADSIAERAESLAILAGVPKHFVQPTVPLAGMVDGDLWYNTTDNLWVTYDGTDWLSDEKITLTFTTNKKVDGTYVSVNGTKGSDAGHPILKNARLKYIAARAASGNATKSFEIRKNGTSTSLFDFSLSSLKYQNDNVGSIDLLTGENLQCFCTSVGSPVNKPVINVIVCWRY